MGIERPPQLRARRTPMVGGRPLPRPGRGRRRGDGAPDGVGYLGRVVGVFGASGVGCSTLCRVVAASCTTPVVVVRGDRGLDWEALGGDAARAAGVVTLLDGVPRDVHDVQALYDSRAIAPGSGGALVRVLREAIVDHVFDREARVIEAQARMLGLSYYCVHADDPIQGAVDLLVRAGISA